MNYHFVALGNRFFLYHVTTESAHAEVNKSIKEKYFYTSFTAIKSFMKSISDIMKCEKALAKKESAKLQRK